MRLSKEDIKVIKDVISSYIDDAKIYLFGSRVDDSKRGGDIDIYVETQRQVDFNTRLNILVDIEWKGIERKVDLLIKTPFSKHQNIFDTAKKEGVEL